MSKPHKWAKEIHAWADGAELEYRWKDQHKQEWSKWEDCKETQFYYFDYEFRIKPQPIKPQYLYAYMNCSKGGIEFCGKNEKIDGYEYIGKIKLEKDDE